MKKLFDFLQGMLFAALGLIVVALFTLLGVHLLGIDMNINNVFFSINSNGSTYAGVFVKPITYLLGITIGGVIQLIINSTNQNEFAKEI